MTDSIEKSCPKCGQQLRFPKDVGGVVMACPACGKKFYSDFKFGGRRTTEQQGVLTRLFEFPNNMVKRFFRS